FIAVFAAAQLGNRGLRTGIAGEVIPAEALQGADPASQEGGREGSHGIGGGDRPSLSGQQLKPWSASRAAGGLSVKAAVGGVLVLRPAGSAHWEARHRRALAVVGRPGHNRQSGTAVGAVEERIAIAAVGGIEQFREAVRTGGHVRGDKDRAGT